MTYLRMATHYEAPIEHVFEFATDFSHYPEWNVNYVEIKEITGPVDKVGTRIHSVMKVLGRSMEGWGEIVEVERPRLIKFAGSGPDGTVKFLYRFEPEGTGTKAEYEFEYELKPGVFAQITDKLFVQRAIERDLKHSMENSKAFVEAKVPVLA